MRWIVGGLLGTLVGCVPTVDSGDGRFVEPGVSSFGSSESGVTEEDDAEASEEEVELDVGSNDHDRPASVECDKVDVLFVIDSSRSMADEQQNLVQAFPGFVDALREDLDNADSYHVGVVSTDGLASDCGDGRLGVLAEGECGPYASGQRYMTDADDLATTFECAGLVGTAGSGDERPAEALISALEDDGGCNEGFRRDDALLVIVIVTDEEDDHETEEGCGFAGHGSPDDPADWFSSIVQIKGGIETNVVVLALVGPEDPDACSTGSGCGDSVGAEPAPRLIEFAEMFTYGFVGPVCGDYPPLFADAIGSISTACDHFTPVG